MSDNKRNKSAGLVAFAVLLSACTSAAEKQSKAELASRAAISAESTTAAVAASLPSNGQWDEPHLVERLVRSGLAPQALHDQKGEDYWKAPVHAYQIGPSVLYAYIYPDSLARRAVTSTLDTLMAAPAGKMVYPMRHILILQNNLAAVMVGGSDTQQERVRLAIEAGLAADKR
ncbi:MAG TPA: hypothetical protein VGQ30_14765 [Gemmatimonadaceae bacterium]|jgi:hypothetical protein|nr:hypothetical protein [Gemmatimonadaceae bacterium]